MVRRILLLMTTLTVLALTVLVLTDFGAAPAEIPDWVNYPGSEWQTITPEQAGLDIQKFNEWVKSQTPRFGKAYGGQKPNIGGVVITRAGYILHTWGDPDFKYHSASLGKTFTRMALQLAVDKGLLRSSEDLVKDYWTGAGQLTPHKVMTKSHNVAVSFRHLWQMRAGFPVSNGWFWRTQDPNGMIGSTEIPSWAIYTGDPDYDNYAHVAPGTTSRYSSGGYWRLSQALTAVWQKDLKEVLDENIMSIIGIPPERWDWLYGEEVRKNRDFYPQMPDYGGYIDPPYIINGIKVRGGPGWVVMSAKDFARLGLLIATQGVWNGERLISELGGNVGVGANTVDGWGVVEGKLGYFSFGKVATGFSDPTPELMASWIVSAPKGSAITMDISPAKGDSDQSSFVADAGCNRTVLGTSPASSTVRWGSSLVAVSTWNRKGMSPWLVGQRSRSVIREQSHRLRLRSVLFKQCSEEQSTRQKIKY